MSNEQMTEGLIEYIYWRGDLLFEQSPFNEVDNVVLSELVYLDLSPVLDAMSGHGPTLKEAYQKICELGKYKFRTAFGGNEPFVRAVAESRRFGSLRLTYYKDVFEKERVQFAAVHFELNNTTSYIAFRGTDNSIIGWREDFMTSFTKIPGQEIALEYLKETMQKSRDYYLGGHSKGGNLAIYAGSLISPMMRRHVLRIFDNDGPGFCEDVYDLNVIRQVDPILTKIVPEYDVIGQLFWREIPDVRIVKTSAAGLFQHDLMSWKARGPQLIRAEQLDPSVKLVNETLDDWIRTADAGSRAAFVKDLFDSFQINGAVNLNDLSLKAIPDVLKAMMDSSEETKELVKTLQKTYLENVKKHAGKLIGSFAEEKMGLLNGIVKKTIKEEETEAK